MSQAGRRAWILVAGTVLLGCGGSSTTDSPDVARSAEGRLIPAVAGVTVGEYAADGSLLQLSTPTAADGSFRFRQALSGLRVTALTTTTPDRVPDKWSGLIRETYQVRLDPMTTVQEQAVRFGAARSDVDAALIDTIGGACGAQAADQARTVLLPESPAEAPVPSDWLLRAMAAYIRALNDVGLTSDTEWLGKLTDHHALLGSMCEVARRIETDQAWLDALRARVPDLDSLSTADGLPAIVELRAKATDEVLRLVATAAAPLEYPELGGLFEPQLAAWSGQEVEISLRYAEALAGNWRALNNPVSLATGAADRSSFEAPSLSRSGDLRVEIGRTLQTGEAGWRFLNETSVDRPTLLSINGVPMFDDLRVVMEMLRMPRSAPDESLHVRAWRFVTAWRKPAVPFSSGLFVHQLDLYLRSIGAGRCDDNASVLWHLWKLLGYEARIWGLGSHIVAEVRVNGRWEAYDPHYGVYYLTRDGVVASVADLERSPDLVTQPVMRLDVDDEAYSAEIADVYAVVEDNRQLQFYEVETQQPMDRILTVPAGGRLDVLAGTTYSFPSLQWSAPGASVSTAQVRLWIPPTFSGRSLDMPLVLADAKGSGTMTAAGTEFRLTADGIRDQLVALYDSGPLTSAPDVGIARVTFADIGPEGVTLTLMLNSRYFDAASTPTVAAFIADPGGLRVEGLTAAAVN